jgi:tRNA dimethylallyltransferase
LHSGYLAAGVSGGEVLFDDSMKKALIVIVGPTASGKSQLAIELARKFGGEIVGCDSIQVYKYLNIGSAKVTEAEQEGIRHHLIDLLEPDQPFTAGDYLCLGRQALQDIQRRNHVPFVVGGTGLYLRALLEGLFEGPKRSDKLRQKLNDLAESKGNFHLHQVLERVDPVSSRKISVNDRPKMIRAIEVFLLTSKPLSWHFQAGRDPLQGFEVLKIGLNPPRHRLYELIDRRVDQMFAKGLVEEVRSILSWGFAPELKPFESLGYFQVVRFLNGEIGLSEAVALAKRDTRRYAKRQLTWFQKEEECTWYDSTGADPQLQARAKAAVAAFLKHMGIEADLTPCQEVMH